MLVSDRRVSDVRVSDMRVSEMRVSERAEWQFFLPAQGAAESLGFVREPRKVLAAGPIVDGVAATPLIIGRKPMYEPTWRNW
jgi:hypothetical protein